LLENVTNLYPLIDDVRPPGIPVARVRQVRERWTSIEHEPVPRTESIQVEGRIHSIRQSGKGLIFMDIVQDDERLQVVVNKIKAGIPDEEFVNNHRLLRRGDIVSTSDPKHTRLYFSQN
jgi:lysyl-tRNA synthetase class 2